jgi:energy-coupling factor transporter ATP-binding protein EcfA2
LEKGSKDIDSYSNIRKNVLMVLGLSGTGKSTLVNYLNDIPLVGKRFTGKGWRVDLKYENVTLSECFAIGHKTVSKTLYPCFYSPKEEDFSYIDNPGFRDSRGLGVEISTSYFRREILKKVDNIKFLLLISHQSLQIRGNQFRDSIKCFSDFLGIFDNEDDIQKLSKSIGLIISRVENGLDTDEEMIASFKEILIDILDEDKKKGEINDRQDLVFRQAIENNQIKIFSVPQKDGLLDNRQKHEIFNLIEKISYIRKDEANIRFSIQVNYLISLNKFTANKYESFKKNVSGTIKNALENY